MTRAASPRAAVVGENRPSGRSRLIAATLARADWGVEPPPLHYERYDGGRTWADPLRVNDNAGPTEALQPNLDVAPNGTVVDAFYDRRLTCPAQGTAEAAGAGIANDPGTSASPGTPYGRANY